MDFQETGVLENLDSIQLSLYFDISFIYSHPYELSFVTFLKLLGFPSQSFVFTESIIKEKTRNNDMNFFPRGFVFNLLFLFK